MYFVTGVVAVYTVLAMPLADARRASARPRMALLVTIVLAVDAISVKHLTQER
jgi:hypothetical protein